MAEKNKKESAHAENSAIGADRFLVALNTATGASVAKEWAPAASHDECRPWADHPVMLARTLHHDEAAPAPPSRPAAPALVTHAVDRAVRQDASGFSGSALGR